MKVLLCAVNAKYIHSNLAVWSLKAYSRQAAKKGGWEVKIKEYTINHYEEEILSDIYQEKADVVVFSCYIWNISMIYSICENLKLVSPGTKIWLGGPEVSYDSEMVLKNHQEISLVMRGEGEKTFAQAAEEAGIEVSTMTFDAESVAPNSDLIAEAVTLGEGQVTNIVETEEGYYIAQVTSLLDREATDAKKTSIVSERQQTLYNDLCEQWLEEAEIKEYDKVWDKVDFEKKGVTFKSTQESTEEKTEE